MTPFCLLTPPRWTRRRSGTPRCATRGLRGSCCRCASTAPRPSTAPRSSACTRSAICSSTCPRDRREARAIADLVPDETATVIVEVQQHLLAERAPARDAAARRGHGGGRDRSDEGRVLQPAVARPAIPARDAADAPREVPVAQPLRRPGPRADGRGRDGGRGGGPLPGDRGPVLDADPRARPPGGDAVRGCRRAVAGGCARGARGSPTAGAHCGRRTSRRARPTSRRRGGGLPSTSYCSSSSRCCAAGAVGGPVPSPRCSTSRDR